MSLAVLEGVAGALLAVAAAALLWREAIRRESYIRIAYRAFAVAALLWGAGFVDAEGMAVSGTGTSLTSADLLTLLALPALGVGLFALARANGEADGDDRPEPRGQVRSAAAWLADACLLAAALFIIDWIALLGAEYRRTGESAGAFALQAIHPIADLVALGVLVAVAVRAGRAALAPYLALLLVTLGDSLAVGARINTMRPGPWAVVILLAGFCVLGATPLAAGIALANARTAATAAWAMPPDHGASVVRTILVDQALSADWLAEQLRAG